VSSLAATAHLARTSLTVLAAAYLAGVWLDGVGSTLASAHLPLTANYFLQVAALFPKAAVMSIDYRAEGWVCADNRWEEFDTRPYFPIDSDNKENRFQRVMHFFREERTTMHALEAYLVDRHNSGRLDDGLPGDKAITGIRLVSLRIPLPQPGDRLELLQRRPLSEYADSQKRSFYRTPKSKIVERCASGDPGLHRSAE
jgi:hypothetical protein